MTTMTLVFVIVLFAIIMWLVPHMDGFLKKLMYVVALVCVLFWLLGMFNVIVPVGIR